MKGWGAKKPFPRCTDLTMHKQLSEAGGDHAARQRSYLHEELGPGGGVLHHAVHHGDESFALTHLQQRKEWTDGSHSDPCTGKLSQPSCADFPEAGTGSSPWGQPPALPADTTSGPALTMPTRKGHRVRRSLCPGFQGAPCPLSLPQGT